MKTEGLFRKCPPSRTLQQGGQNFWHLSFTESRCFMVKIPLFYSDYNLGCPQKIEKKFLAHLVIFCRARRVENYSVNHELMDRPFHRSLCLNPQQPCKTMHRSYIDSGVALETYQLSIIIIIRVLIMDRQTSQGGMFLKATKIRH